MVFDPYATWLGIPADRRPPTFYDLLGVALDEPDPVVIEQAALRRMGKVRQHQLGPHSERSQEILAELARARLILMDPDRRADYDATLRPLPEIRPDPSADPQNAARSHARRRRPRPDEETLDGLGSLVVVERESEGRPILRPGAIDAPSSGRKGLIIGTALAVHAVILGAFLFYHFGRPASRQEPPATVRNDRVSPKPSSPIAPKKPEQSQPLVAQRTVAPAAPGRRDLPATKGPSGPTRAGQQGTQPGPAGALALSNVKNAPRREDPGEEDQQEGSGKGDPPDQVLKKHGLKSEGSHYVLEGEAEAREKATEIRRLAGEWERALKRQQATPGREARQQEINYLIDEIDRGRIVMRNDDEAMRRIPRFRGAFHNPDDQALFYALRDERDRVQAALDMANESLKQLRRAPINSDAKEKADAMVRDCRESYEQACDEFHKLVESTTQKYKELDSDPEVRRALDAMRKKAKVTRRIGPSPEFEKAKKEAEQVEKSMSRRRPF